MSANLETLRQDMEKLHFPKAAIDIVAEAEVKLRAVKDAPSSVELAEKEQTSLYQTGLLAREIGQSSLANQGTSEQRVAGVGFGEDIRTKNGGLLTVTSYHVVGDNELAGEKSRLAITIQDLGNDPELLEARKKGFFTFARGVTINTNLRDNNFGHIDELRTQVVASTVFATGVNPIVGSREVQKLGLILLERVTSSDAWQAFQDAQGKSPSEGWTPGPSFYTGPKISR